MRVVKLLLRINIDEENGSWKFMGIYSPKEHEVLFQTDLFSIKTETYKTVDIFIPDWISNDYLSREFIAIRWTFKLGFDIKWGVKWFDKIKYLSKRRQFLLMRLLRSTPTKSIQKSLKSQATDWLNYRNTSYLSPFSARQWEILYDKWAIKAFKNKVHETYMDTEFSIILT